MGCASLFQGQGTLENCSVEAVFTTPVRPGPSGENVEATITDLLEQIRIEFAKSEFDQLALARTIMEGQISNIFECQKKKKEYI